MNVKYSRESASGALIQLKATSSEEILYEKRLPVESKLTIKIPKQEYIIILDGGEEEEDKIIKDGIAPKKGFTKKGKRKEV